MDKVSYYPGCTLKTTANKFETSAMATLAALGTELVEIPRWNCCGVVHSLANDDLMHLVAPIRNLIRTREQGSDQLVTLCSMCYNTVARANLILQREADKRRTINLFMDDEPDYDGSVAVLHLLSFLRDRVGWQRLSEQVKTPLNMRIVPYYGCMLQRPREVAIEPLGNFDALTGFLEALGAVVPAFSAADRCCGSYQVLGNPSAAKDVGQVILGKAKEARAEAIAVVCPLCHFNLNKVQAELSAEQGNGKVIPILYFTQLSALALGLVEEGSAIV